MEADEQEDLLENDFFKLVKQKFPSVFEQVEANGYLICVPQQAALTDLSTVDQHFVGTSIYFLGSASQISSIDLFNVHAYYIHYYIIYVHKFCD
jgi:hypothetical protein